jgi:mediator of replication checkpoint protein 1
MRLELLEIQILLMVIYQNLWADCLVQKHVALICLILIGVTINANSNSRNKGCVTEVPSHERIVNLWFPTPGQLVSSSFPPNMSIGKEYSIVADSTISSSPQLAPDASTLVKRPLRTYGRRREEPPAEDAGISVTFLGHIHGNADSVHCTAPPGLSEEVPPSSPRTNHPGRCDTNDDEAPESTKFNYTWRTELKRLDDDHPEENDPRTTSLFGQPNLLHVATGTSTDSSLRTEPRVLQSPPSASDDVLYGLSLDSPPQIVSAKPSFVLSPPAVSRTRNSRVIQDSDSEPEALKGSSSTTPSSSSQLQNLISPKSPSLSTPPTSEDDMPANILTKPRSTGRRKPLTASRGSVPPLEFSESPSSEVRRPSGTKPKSRKLKVCQKYSRHGTR